VNYVVRNRSDEDRAAFIKPFQDILKTEEGQKPLEEDAARRRKIFSMVLSEVKGLGDGSEKGVDLFFRRADNTDWHSEIEGFFNLLYSHLFALYPADSPETKQYLTTLLQIFSLSPSEQALIKYRMYDRRSLHFYWSSNHVTLFPDYPTSSMLHHGNLLSACLCTTPSCKSQVVITS